ncbi:pentatricopeptide repeat-containing protein At1g53600, mitochondrial [Magnolia sinica]|uniref:pentatricopeptide repeat-containing protein At1g53600, mitochondrial n=1 Tax=Magnolia sinica TaxID=86752 RepID=UPI002659B893|nr:pentatricopeptide repeat-containing protein At1g53600, mitochondrial [Magnolia sinica]
MLEKPISNLLCKRLPRLNFSDSICNYSFPATQILSKPKPRKPTSPNSRSRKCLIFCNSQITKNGRNGNLEEAESVFNRMPIRDVVSWTALLTAYADNGKTETARMLFDRMPERNIASWNAMITAYVHSLQIAEAFELFSQMPDRNPVSYTAMITGFVRVGLLSEAKKLYSEMPLIGRDPVASNALISGYLKIGNLEEAVWVFERMLERDVVSWSSMVDGYCKKGRIADARAVFEVMPERNVVSWTAMIDGHLKNGAWEDGFGTFLRMRREGMGVNSMTLTVIFDACADFGRFIEGVQVHGLVLSMGFEWDVFLGNSMITMYSSAGWMDAAKTIFNIMNKKDIVSWNSLIAGYVQNDKIEEAYALFEKMPNTDVVSWTAIVVGFLNRGRIEESIRIFKDIPAKDDVAWTAIISGFVGNEDYECAFHWFVQMVQEGIKPNSLTFSSMLSASAGLAALNQGMQIHACVLKTDLGSNISVQNSLVSMYAKCGNVDDAYTIFTGIGKPNLVSMNSMITGFAQHGFGQEALRLFREMKINGYQPNEITFLGILSACVHAGLVEEGWEHFKSMSSSYCIEPGPDHYTCMVDLLGRAGLLKEAMDLIDSMPFQPQSAVWGALLGASRIHEDLGLAKLAARRLFELEPDGATAYAVLSNMYSKAGLKKDEEELRMIKKSRRVKKNPGCSWITVNNKVHLFLAGDQSNTKFKEIQVMLRKIAVEMVDGEQ